MYAKRIKELRTTLDISMAKMSVKIDIPARTITSYERSERTPSIEFLTQLCNILNVNANWFVTGVGEMFNPPKFEEVQDELTSKVEDILRKNGLIK